MMEQELKNVIPLSDEYIATKCTIAGMMGEGTYKMKYYDCPVEYKGRNGEALMARGWILTLEKPETND